MGIGIINCFMIVFAFAAIPFLLHDLSTSDSGDRDFYNQQLEHIRQFDSNENNHVTFLNTYH